jgi:hypothetical protein
MIRRGEERTERSRRISVALAARARSREPRRSMVIREWQTWNTYAFVLPGALPSLVTAAAGLVGSGLMPAVRMRDGLTVWLDKSGEPQVSETESRPNASLTRGSLTMLPDTADLLARQSAFQAAYFRNAEQRLFTPHTGVPGNYIRGLMAPAGLYFAPPNEARYALYPTFTLYESGVALLGLRMIGSEALEESDFIRRFVSVNRRGIDELLVPPVAAQLNSRAAAPRSQLRSPFARWRVNKVIVETDRDIDSAVEGPIKLGDTECRFVPLRAAYGGSGQYRLTDLASVLARAAMYAASGMREGWPMIIRGQRRLADFALPFYGRVHTYIIAHDDQRATAEENEAVHGDTFGRILMQFPNTTAETARKHLPQSSRIVDDVAWYPSNTSTLTVWSESGRATIEQFAPKDGNRGEFIYEQHARNEMLEYGHALHRRAVVLASAPEQSARAAVLAQRSVLDFDARLLEATHFGEVRDYLAAGWDALGVPELRARARDLLTVQKEDAALVEAESDARWTTTLTLVFGALAVSPLASDVVAPLWELFGVTLFTGRNPLVKLAQVGIAAGLIGAVLTGAWLLQRARRRKRVAVAEDV